MIVGLKPDGWAQDAWKDVASRTPSQALGAAGDRQRMAPWGGAAKGTPWNSRTTPRAAP